MWVFDLFICSVIVISPVGGRRAITPLADPGLEDNPDYRDSCGLDFTDDQTVVEGEGKIDDYPWLGILIFPIGSARATSAVVLVTRQMVIGSASEIDKLPKTHFRLMSRVVLGTNSSGPRIRIREYTYHSDYSTETSSSLALIQLDMDHVKFDVYPICGPPTHFYHIRTHAFTLNEDCQHPVVTIKEMKYVHHSECKRYYRRNGLDVGSMWPTRTTCARATSGKECVWRGGAALAAKMGERWHLLGFGVYGPGCTAPSRFIDYGAHVSWVKRSVERIGRPAVTRMGPGSVILRRTISSLQRFGQCDAEEQLREMYTDKFRVVEADKRHKVQRIRYNLSLYDELEYSCVVFEVFHNLRYKPPHLRLRRWCAQPTGFCFGFQHIAIDFYLEIEFVAPMTFKMAAYGRHPIVIDVKAAMKYYVNQRHKKILNADENWKAYVNTTRDLFWVRSPLNITLTPEQIARLEFEQQQLKQQQQQLQQLQQLKLLQAIAAGKVPRATLNDSPLDGYESFYFDMYNVNIKKEYNKNQRIYNESFAQTLWGDERRQYFRYLGLHSTYNPDAYQHTNSSDGDGAHYLDYTEYLSLDKKFGTKTSQTTGTTRTKTELQTKPITNRRTVNDSPLNGYELFHFDTYNVNMKKDYNKKQRIYNESFAQTLWADERRQYFRYLGLHSIYNPDAYHHTTSSYLGVVDPDYTEYLSLQKKFGTKSSQTLRIPTRTTTELQTEYITTRGPINDSPLDGYELFHFDMYNVNIKKDNNKNQRIYNESIAQTYWDDERRQYYRYLGLHSTYNPDAYQHTTSSYGGVVDPDYTEYLSLEKKFGTRSLQTECITTRTKTEPITTRGTINNSPLDGDELSYFNMYNKNMEKKHNKNQRIYNESIAQTYWDDERRQYYRYLGLHSLFNRDAGVNTYKEYGEMLRPNYTEYLFLEKKFGMKSSQTDLISARTRTELQTEPITTRGAPNDSPLDGDELFYFNMYNKNMEKKHNKNQRIYNESIAQSYWDDERRQYYRYLGLHSLFNRDAGVNTYKEYGEMLRPNYTEYLFLENKFGMKSSQTEPITTRPTTELRTERITTRGSTNVSP